MTPPDDDAGRYEPPFRMTGRIEALAAGIAEQADRIAALSRAAPGPRLRRANRIRTIHSSLAIEQNSLSLEQVTAILDGKRILGNPNEIKEVTNAYEAYELMFRLDPSSVGDLLKAHGIMMKGLVRESGVFRSGGVGVFEGGRLIHLAPPAALVPEQMERLFAWHGKSGLHPLVRAAVFHYEFEFIHPFADGNGRMGRLWHTLLLGQWKALFYWLPIEDLIRSRQREYYAALGRSDRDADSTAFVELMLEIISDTLRQTTVPGEE